jgi:hypothetical protein
MRGRRHAPESTDLPSEVLAIAAPQQVRRPALEVDDSLRVAP